MRHMHFWIDKRSQGCGYSGRHLFVPPSISGYGRNQRFLCRGSLHPEPMVTPVHRFQSIESVANNGIRHVRSGNSSRYNHFHPTVHQYNLFNSSSSNNARNTLQSEMITVPSSRHHNSTTPQRTSNSSTPTTKLKCGVWLFFAIVTLFLASAKYYFHGINIGMEAFAFCSLLVIILVIGGLVSLYEAVTAAANNPESALTLPETTPDEEIPHENQVPTNLPPNSSSATLSPPPYHIAIMLPSQNETTNIQILRDSPPPSYEKAVA